MEVNKFPDFQKCGDILIDVKSKNKKNKTYMFRCTFCDMKFNELKKFSLHIGEEHFNNFDDIAAGVEVKTETEEIQVEAFSVVEKTDPKVDVAPEVSQVETFTVIERPDLKDYKTAEEDGTNLYPIHLGNVLDDHLSCEVKNELMDEESIFCDAEVNAISESDKEAMEEVSVSRTSADTSVLFDSESDNDADKTPLKKMKLATQDKKAKKKTMNNETNYDESKEGDCNEKKTKLTRAEVQKRYREKLKQDEKRYAEYKQKARERSSKQSKRGEMSSRMLESVRAKALLRYYNKKGQLRKREKDCGTPASIESSCIENTSSASCANISENEPFINDRPSTSSLNSVDRSTHFSKTLAKRKSHLRSIK